MLCPDWSREWRGETVLVAASGPSQRKEDLDHARGKCRIVVINSTWRLAPWADVLYFCDVAWWQNDGPRGGEFQGRQIVGKDENGRLGFFTANVEVSDRMFWDGKRIGGLHNSGAQVLNLLALWGVKRAILTGYDFSVAKGVHWHGPHDKRPNPTPEKTDKWVRFMHQAAPELKDRGVEVLNASRETALTCFPRVSLRDVL